MKRKTFPFLAFALTVLMMSFTLSEPQPTLELGADAPMTDHMMMDITGDMVSMKTAADQNGLLVIFSCNTCPWVVGNNDKEGWEGRYGMLRNMCESHATGMMLVNSNAARRTEGDSLEDMKERAKEQGFFGAHYVLDENSQLADAFGAMHTPHVFLFDKEMKLVYRGAIDDNCNDSEAVKNTWLVDAIKSNASGKDIKVNDTRPMGCSIKRVK